MRAMDLVALLRLFDLISNQFTGNNKEFIRNPKAFTDAHPALFVNLTKSKEI